MTPPPYTGSPPRPPSRYPFKLRWWERTDPNRPAVLDFDSEEDLNEFVTSLTLVAPRFAWEIIPPDTGDAT